MSCPIVFKFCYNTKTYYFNLELDIDDPSAPDLNLGLQTSSFDSFADFAKALHSVVYNFGEDNWGTFNPGSSPYQINYGQYGGTGEQRRVCHKLRYPIKWKITSDSTQDPSVSCDDYFIHPKFCINQEFEGYLTTEGEDSPDTDWPNFTLGFTTEQTFTNGVLSYSEPNYSYACKNEPSHCLTTDPTCTDGSNSVTEITHMLRLFDSQNMNFENTGYGNNGCGATAPSDFTFLGDWSNNPAPAFMHHYYVGFSSDPSIYEFWTSCDPQSAQSPGTHNITPCCFMPCDVVQVAINDKCLELDETFKTNLKTAYDNGIRFRWCSCGSSSIITMTKDDFNTFVTSTDEDYKALREIFINGTWITPED